MAGWIILENPGKCVHVAVDTCAAQHHRFVDVAKGERKGRDLRPAERKKERKRERERERGKERETVAVPSLSLRTKGPESITRKLRLIHFLSKS